MRYREGTVFVFHAGASKSLQTRTFDAKKLRNFIVGTVLFFFLYLEASKSLRTLALDKDARGFFVEIDGQFHPVIARGGKYGCCYCHVYFSTIGNAKRHVVLRGRTRCPQCRTAFCKRALLKDHMRKDAACRPAESQKKAGRSAKSQKKGRRSRAEKQKSRPKEATADEQVKVGAVVQPQTDDPVAAADPLGLTPGLSGSVVSAETSSAKLSSPSTASSSAVESTPASSQAAGTLVSKKPSCGTNTTSNLAVAKKSRKPRAKKPPRSASESLRKTRKESPASASEVRSLSKERASSTAAAQSRTEASTPESDAANRNRSRSVSTADSLQLGTVPQESMKAVAANVADTDLHVGSVKSEFGTPTLLGCTLQELQQQHVNVHAGTDVGILDSTRTDASRRHPSSKLDSGGGGGVKEEGIGSSNSQVRV